LWPSDEDQTASGARQLKGGGGLVAGGGGARQQAAALAGVGKPLYGAQKNKIKALKRRGGEGETTE
jgi:hypothetical protein